VTSTLTRVIEAQRGSLPIVANPLAELQVAVVGLGSLGSLLAESVVRLGFGRAVLLDRDIVDSSNLYRQTLYDTAALGRPKAVAAEQRLRTLGSKTELIPLVEHLSARNVWHLLKECNLVLCAVDNTAGRMAISDYCRCSGTRWAYGGAIGYRGEAMMFAPPDGPCYACLFPSPIGIPRLDARDCTREGILVPTVMAVAARMVFLALSDESSGFAGHRYTFNGGTLRSATIRIPKNPSCPACSQQATRQPDHTEGNWTVDFVCGNATQVLPTTDLQLDLQAIARRYIPGASEVTKWYLRFAWKTSQEAFLWRNGRLLVTNTQNANDVVTLFRNLTERGTTE